MDWVSQYEGKQILLFEDRENPYESIYIKAGIAQGKLTMTDSECGHGPDGGWSFHYMEFDEDGTRSVMNFLSERGKEPFVVLKEMLNARDRMTLFADECKTRGIGFISKIAI